MACKTFFWSEFSVIPEKWMRKEEVERQLRSILLFKQTQKAFHPYRDVFKNTSNVLHSSDSLEIFF